MSNNPAPRCPGCGNKMRLRRYNCDRGAVNAWYACDCGWSSPIGNDENIAYDKAVKRYTESPWISVKDRQPDPEQTVVRGYRAGINTHWMPIPKLPKEDASHEY